MKYLLSLLCIFLPHIDSKGTLLLKSNIIHSNNEPFINYVIFDENEIIRKCVFEYVVGDTENYLLMDIMNTNVVHDDFFFKDRVSNIGRGLCGVKFSSLRKGDPRNYRLAVTTKDKINATKYYFQIDFQDADVIMDKTISVSLGQSLGISCLKGNSYVLYDPFGNIVLESTTLTHTINYVTMREIGKWRCVIGNNSMEAIEQNIYVKLKEIPKIESWYKEEDGFGKIGCKFIKDESQTLPLCQLVSPTNKVYTVVGSLFTDRYTSIGTDRKEYIFQLEFPLPALSSEIGVWKFILGPYGAFIKVKTDILPDYKRSTKKAIKVGSELDISCEVPYSTDNCVIKAPDGTFHYPDNLLQLTQGVCSKYFKISLTSHIGRWTCYISHPENSQDDEISIEVQSINSIVAIAKEIEITAGDSAQIMFKSYAPLTSCRFKDPTGKSYHLDPTKTDADVKYLGRGLAFGDCGISVTRFTKSLEGTWTCQIREANAPDASEFIEKTNIIVYGGITDNISLAYSVGIPIGVGGALLVLFGFVVFKLYKRHSGRNNDHRRSSGTSGESMRALNVQQSTSNGTFEDTLTVF